MGALQRGCLHVGVALQASGDAFPKDTTLLSVKGFPKAHYFAQLKAAFN